MKILYVDNFRGFNKASIPIEDVNFFVGENSTGKTSILGLLRIIANSDFWYQFDFSLEEGIFGHYKDIVSVSSKDKSYFAFGIVDCVSDNEGKESNEGHFCVFSEKDGMPQLVYYAYVDNINLLEVRVSEKQIRYKAKELDVTCNTQKNIKSIFNLLVKNFKNDKTGYKVFKPKGAFFDTARVSAGLTIGLLRQEVLLTKGNKKKRSSIRIRMPGFFEFAWLAPIRTQPRRTYDEYKLDYSPEGVHTPYLIKKILEKKSDAIDFKVFLEKVGKDSGLFESIKTKTYGRSATSPFELDIILNKNALSINNVGYGVSQSLPVIVEIFARSKHSWFAIQQPEVHLHPKAQAALGDIFFNLATQENKKFIIETHSDYTIDRFRMNYAKKNKKNFPISNILFFSRTNKGNQVSIINIDENGNVSDNQPKGYREFFVKEDLKLLGL